MRLWLISCYKKKIFESQKSKRHSKVLHKLAKSRSKLAQFFLLLPLLLGLMSPAIAHNEANKDNCGNFLDGCSSQVQPDPDSEEPEPTDD